MPGKIEVIAMENGRFGLKTNHGWFAYHYENAEVADKVKHKIYEDWTPIVEDVNFSHRKPLIASSYK